MRKITVLVMALSMLAAMALSATAHHRSPNLTFSTGSTISAGAQVTVTASATNDAGDAQEAGLYECLIAGVGAPAADCNGTAPAGTWSFVGKGTPATKTFTPAAGTYGFRATGTWDSANHGIFEADLTVNAVTSSDRHNACNGIENAQERVASNSASEKAKNKLAAKAVEFNCD